MFINTLFDFYNSVYDTVYDTFFVDNTISTNWVQENILSNPLMISYRWNKVQYNTPFFIPFRNKEQKITILSASLLTQMYVDEEDITDFVISRAGPYHNFFMNPVFLKDILPCSSTEFDQLTLMCVLNGEIITITYHDYHQQIMIHYGFDWGRYMPAEYNNVRNSLNYLDLSC
jgi:hypothetical protein